MMPRCAIPRSDRRHASGRRRSSSGRGSRRAGGLRVHARPTAAAAAAARRPHGRRLGSITAAVVWTQARATVVMAGRALVRITPRCRARCVAPILILPESGGVTVRVTNDHGGERESSPPFWKSCAQYERHALRRAVDALALCEETRRRSSLHSRCSFAVSLTRACMGRGLLNEKGATR